MVALFLSPPNFCIFAQEPSDGAKPKNLESFEIIADKLLRLTVAACSQTDDGIEIHDFVG